MQLEFNDFPFVEEAQKLEELGFKNRRKNAKLLLRTSGNFEVVRNFLDAQKQLKDHMNMKYKFPRSSYRKRANPENEDKGETAITSEIKEIKIEENKMISETKVPHREERKLFREEKKEQKKGIKAEKEKLKEEKRRLKQTGLFTKEEKLKFRDALQNLKAQKKAFKAERSPKKPKFYDEKQSPREEKEKRRGGRRERIEREKVPTLKLESKDAWPIDIEHVYLDGNNMLFVTGPIRKLCLSKQFEKGEQSLENVAVAFASQMKVNLTLMFDDTKTHKQVGTVSVCSARPIFRTSDDAFVHIFQQNPGSKALFVTSDRELTERLHKAGGIIMKPKDWFLFAAEVLGSKISHRELDNWINPYTL